MSDIPRINDVNSGSEVEMLGLHNKTRPCVYYKEEICAAPKLKFKICKKCSRIDPKLVTRSLFDKIMELARRLLDPNVKGLGEAPPEK